MNKFKFRWILECTFDRASGESEEDFNEWCEQIQELDKNADTRCIIDTLEECDSIILTSEEYS